MCVAGRKNRLIGYDKLGRSRDIAAARNFGEIYLFANPRALADNRGRNGKRKEVEVTIKNVVRLRNRQTLLTEIPTFD